MALDYLIGSDSCRSKHDQSLVYNRHVTDNDNVASGPRALPILPPGFPIHLDSKLAWSNSEVPDELEYTYRLTQEDRAEIDNALKSFKAQGIDGDLVNSTNFALPNLQHALRQLAVDLHTGRGFAVIRDFDYDKYSVEDNTVIFLGIQSFIAERRARQDEKGNMLVHIITDDSMSFNPMKESHTRHSRSAIPFHTDDLGDILAFQTRCAAVRGGNCILSPAFTVYNELVATRPDVIWTLSEPNWPLHIPHNHKRALLFPSTNPQHQQRIILNFAPNALLGSKAHPRPSSAPCLTPRQQEALTLLQELASKHALTLPPLGKGDMHFFNNLALMHRRDAADVPKGSKRHLVRMCLRNEALRWGVPRALGGGGWEEAYCSAGGGGGDGQDGGGVEQVWHLEPMPDVFFPLVRKPN